MMAFTLCRRAMVTVIAHGRTGEATNPA